MEINSVSERIQETLQEIREFLDVDRVALYQFLENGSGEVIAEALSQNCELSPLLQLRFPASDIPETVRKRFLAEQVRILVDVGLGRKRQYFPHGHISTSYVNPSPCHLSYLKHLNIQASITYPIILRKQLWGLLLIHHSRNQYWQSSHFAMLELLAERVTLLITTEELSAYQQALLHRETTIKTIRNLIKSKSETAEIPLRQILETAVKCLNGCGGRIYRQQMSGEIDVYEIGKQPIYGIFKHQQPWQPSAIVEETQQWQRYLLHADQVPFPDLDSYVSVYDLGKVASVGNYVALVIPFSSRLYREGYLTIFRQNCQQTIWWAGRPPQNKQEMAELRGSFRPWQEVIQLSALESWTTEEMRLGCTIAQLLEETFHQQEFTNATISQDHYHSLTQLPNRNVFSEKVNLVCQATTPSQELFAVVFLDLDRFQQVNNTLGHPAGDKLLKLVAERLQNSLANQDYFLAHWNGDKFVILLRHLTNLDSAAIEEKFSAIGQRLQAPFSLFGHEVYVKASWGIAISPYDGTDAETLLLNAETAMYSAKEQGRNRYQVYSPSLRSPLNPLTLEAEIRNSLRNHDFCLYYQPQMNLQTGAITAVEALIRWQHPQRGLLSPKHFISFAEESDLICEIGNWVLKTACQQLAQWREQGIHQIRVAVNVSGRQFQKTEFVDKIQQILEATHTPGSALEIEITETTAAQNIDRTHWILKQLQQMGVSVALDDFGIGYSSLNAIKNFPLNTLKIDRTFIEEIQSSAIDSAIVNSVVSLAQGLNLRVVAEGVETFQQLETLRSLTVTQKAETFRQEVQGYFISEPLAASNATEFLINSNCEPRFFSSENQDLPVLDENHFPDSPSSGNSSLQQLFNQTRREQLIAQISQQIHASLDLAEIFQVTVTEIREFLQTDRVLLYRFDQDWNGQVVIESVDGNWESLIHREIDDPCFQIKSAPLYLNGRVLVIEDIEQTEMTPCYREMLRSFQVRANLVIPLLNQENLWGLLIAHHCRSRRSWHPTEVSLLKQLATQVGVAIHQAELYQQLQQANQKLEELAIQDGLTEIANRRWFDETLDRQWQRLQREQQPLSLILCDIDEFKLYNDYYGHQKGDHCLIRIAKALQRVVHRPDDLVARYGGEEFALILPNTSADNAMVVAERARQAVVQLNIAHDLSSVTPHVTLSLGIGALIPGTKHSRKELIRRADQALYQAKAQGRDRAIKFADPTKTNG